MKTHRISVLALWLSIAFSVSAQTPDDYVAWGRISLADTNVSAANAAFSYALALDPNHQAANFFMGATRLLMLPSLPAGSNFLNRLGVPTPGRDIYNWTALPPMDKRGALLAPAGVNANEFTAMLRTNILNALIDAEANLAKVTNTSFILNLTGAETRAADVTVDYGDVQLLRALLQGAEYCIYTLNSENLDVQLSAIRSWNTDQVSVERVLMDYPSLFTFATTNDLVAAKAAFQKAAERYMAGSQFIRNRSGTSMRLFNFENFKEEQDFRSTLTDLTNSFSHAVTLAVETNYTVFLASQFTGQHSTRSFLPRVVGNGFVLGTLPDPTFGGLIAGLPVGIPEGFLATHLRPIPSISPVFNRVGGQFQFPVRVLAGRGYVMQASTDLRNWSDLTSFVGETDTHLFNDANAASFARRFYRLEDRTAHMPPPANANFDDRFLLSGIGITTIGYTELYGTAWWSWTAPISGNVVVSTTGSGSYAYGYIWLGSSQGALSLVSYVDQPFNAVAGTTYQIQVECDGPPPCMVKLTITPPPVVQIFSPADGTVYSGVANILISASATDDGSISRLSFFGDYGELCRTSGPAMNFTWTNVQPGYHYLECRATDNLGVSTSDYREIRVAPTNDDFANRLVVTGAQAAVTGTSSGATKEPGEPNHAGGLGGASVWWSWTAPASGKVFINASLTDVWGYSLATLLGVYTGNSVSNLTMIATNAAYGPAQVNFNATAGSTYQIAVDANYGNTGNVLLNLQLATTLSLNAAVTNLSGATDSERLYRVNIPNGLASLQIAISGGTGDCDLYVQQGYPPTLDQWEYRPYLDGNNETVTISSPMSGDWYIMLHGYAAYSGVTLLAH